MASKTEVDGRLSSLVYFKLKVRVQRCYVQMQTFGEREMLALQGEYKYVQMSASTLVGCASLYDMPWYFKQKFQRWRQMRTSPVWGWSWTSLELEQRMSSNLVNIQTEYLQYTMVGLYTNVMYDE